MDTHEALLTRRSIRRYLAKPVSTERIKKIMTAAIWAPSGGNSQPWRFYVATGVKRDTLVQAMIEASGTDAPSPVEYEAMAKRIEEAARNEGTDRGLMQMGEDGKAFGYLGSLRFYDAPVVIAVTETGQKKGSSGHNIGATVENLLLAAHGEGIGACWLGIPLRFSDKIVEILEIPDEETLVTTVSLGYPDTESPINLMGWGTGRARLPFDEVVHLVS